MQSVGVLGFIYLAGVLGERVQYDLRKRMFNHLQELSFSYFSRTPVGWIMSRVTSDSERIAQLVTWGMVDVTWAVFNITTAMIFMLWINWQLALIVLAIIPILFWVAVQFKKRILVQFRVVRKINSKITGEYNQNITGVRVVKALGREDANLADFTGLTNEMYGASYRAAWLSALFLPAVQLISSLCASAPSCSTPDCGAGFGGMTIGAIAAFFGYITFMLWPIQDLARVYSELQNAIASAERVFSLVDAQPDIADQDGAFDPGTIRGDIEFDHVDFYYEADKPVLTDFSLNVQRGRDDRAGRADRRRQVHHREPGLPVLRAEGGRPAHRRARLPRATRCTASIRASAWCCRRRTSSPARCARTSATAGWTPPTPRSRKPRRSPARTSSSPRWTAATAPRSARAAAGSRSARSSSSAWRARCWRTPKCW